MVVDESTYAQQNLGAPDADADRDGMANLLEYAFGLNSAPAVSTDVPLQLTRNSTGGVDALLRRPAASQPDIRVSLQVSTAKEGPWQMAQTVPRTTYLSDGSRALVFSGLQAATGQLTTYVRAVVELDADLNGQPETSATSDVHGFAYVVAPVGISSHRLPFLTPAVYRGRVSEGSSARLLADCEGLSGLLAKGGHYVLQVASGLHAGQVLEVDEASSDDHTIALTALPPVLTGSMVRLHRQHTAASQVPAEWFSAIEGDQITFFTVADTASRWLAPSGIQWLEIATGRKATADIVRPGSLLGVKAGSSQRALLFTGEVPAPAAATVNR
jgi:hypothetical protein